MKKAVSDHSFLCINDMRQKPCDMFAAQTRYTAEAARYDIDSCAPQSISFRRNIVPAGHIADPAGIDIAAGYARLSLCARITPAVMSTAPTTPIQEIGSPRSRKPTIRVTNGEA